MVAIFGAHLVLNLVFMVMLYIVIYLVMWTAGKISSRSCYTYKVVQSDTCERTSDHNAMTRQEEMVKLTENEV